MKINHFSIKLLKYFVTLLKRQYDKNIIMQQYTFTIPENLQVEEVKTETEDYMTKLSSFIDDANECEYECSELKDLKIETNNAER